ncbi:chaperone regulator [Clavulina sp. PMI_390]|nr:chaperone regulator [Clavulina sp. PMI_390]
MSTTSKQPEAGPSTSTAPPKELSQQEKDDLEKTLNREAAAFQRDMEVERILKAFKLNPYDILGMDYFDVTEEDVKKRYKKLSLFIHPDKATHPRAPDAFDLLKKAAAELSEKEKRLDIDSTIAYARNEVLKAASIPTSTADNDVKILAMQPSFKEQLQKKVKDLLFDEELRKRRAFKMNLANEGMEAKKKEEEAAAKKRKAEEDANWEATRDNRIEGWRSFQNGGGPKKKKKTKVQVLG